MTTNHIDQMHAWWDEATPGIPKTGDTYIEDERHRGSSFRIVEAATDHKYGFDNIRILARAPKPKPAWHDAVAVIAHIGGNELPRVLARDNDGAFVDGVTGSAYMADRLRAVTPLIEAKVTDEMLLRYLNHSWGVAESSVDAFEEVEAHVAREALAAALGLETA